MFKSKLAALCAALSMLVTSLSVAAPISKIEMADKLNGCWQHINGGSREYWADTGYNLLFGYAITVRDGKLTAFEDMRIEGTGNEITFVASPNGTAPVRFVAVMQSEQMITFQNPAHDYPQVITYARDKHKLIATISAMGGENPFEFVMQKCDTP